MTSVIVADTSVIINGYLADQIESGSIRNSVFNTLVLGFCSTICIFESYYNDMITLFKTISIILLVYYGLKIILKGSHPSIDDIKFAASGRIDALIIDIAKQNNAILYTSDNVQHLVAAAEDVQTVFLRPKIISETLEFLKFFDNDTMSIHLKENQYPLGKKGKPGNFLLTKIGEDILSRDYLKMISSQILSATNISDSSNVEISKTGASVIQHDDYRIVITYPPFSESYEITIVHPTVNLSLEDYTISEALMKRLTDRAEGILISGAPGSGKSTLASGLANFYHEQGSIVKTFESPRDLQVNDGITQYSKLDGSFDKKYIVIISFVLNAQTEVRRREDFTTFSDLRLTGVGMIGVIHANSPLDAIQRFIGKIELGIIPNVLDTVVFVNNGDIEKVYDLELKVKVPTGMTESDLARPVIEIRNFEDNVLEHEIYTFGEENVIVPVVKRGEKAGIEKLAEDKIKDYFKKYDSNALVEILSANRVKVMGELVDKQSKSGNINEIEKFLNVHIDIVAKDSELLSLATNDVSFTFSESKSGLLFTVNREYTSMYVDIHANEKFFASVRVGKKGQIKILKRSDIGRNLLNSTTSPNDIQLFLKDF